MQNQKYWPHIARVLYTGIHLHRHGTIYRVAIPALCTYVLRAIKKPNSVDLWNIYRHTIVPTVIYWCER